MLPGGPRHIIAAYRKAFPPSAAGIPATDVGGQRLATIAAGRAIDGIAVAVQNAALPNDPDVTAESQNVRNAIAALSADLTAALGTVGSVDALAWRREDLAYRVDVAVDHPTTGPLLLRATPDRDAAFRMVCLRRRRGRRGRPADRTAITTRPFCMAGNRRNHGKPDAGPGLARSSSADP